MMKTLFKTEGAQFSVEILAEPEVQEFIGEHAAVLDSSFRQVEMSEAMRHRLTRSDYIFSGMKTFHELNEAFPSLLDENGDRKTFERFLNDVRKIDETYNSNYLRAEYNFVQASAAMADKWEEFAKDGDRYNLQYRTAGDGKVRPEHAELHGVTLPMTDPFWEEFYPPNGWGCRCTVVQVRKSKYPETPHDEAMALGEAALQRDTKGIFRFNPGKEGKAMPDYNPYTIRRCKDCDIAKGKMKLAFVPDNELCEACQLIRRQQHEEGNRRITNDEFNELRRDINDWSDTHLDLVEINGVMARRSFAVSSDGYRIGIGKGFFSETITKNKRNRRVTEILEATTHFAEWIPMATRTGTETGIHHDFEFSVYRVTWNGYDIEFKCKMTDGELLYNMRFI